MDLGNLTIPELKNILRDLGLPVSGRKRDLINRILEFTEQAGGEGEIDYFMHDADISENQQKYCRCVLHVSAKQPQWCLKDKAWRETREGTQCYNPYAVCTASVGRKGYRDCFKYYNLDNIPENELVAMESLKGKTRKELREYWKKERKQKVAKKSN